MSATLPGIQLLLENTSRCTSGNAPNYANVWETKKRHSVPSQETFSEDLRSGEPADTEHGQTGSGMLHCLSLPYKENVALRCRIGRPQRGHNSDCGDREDTPAKKSTMACFRSVWLSPSVESRERSETPGSCKDKVVIGD